MARISGVDLPPNKRVEIGLTYIFGIGRARAVDILEKAKVDRAIRVRDMSDDEVLRITRVINQEGRVEGDLRKAIALDIKRLIENGSYRGMRHRRNLPCRGQRTNTNARTRRGPRRAIAGKKKATR
ncbi:30S ribosomal protein S13 [Acidobacteria bacterium Mor1]|nr:30S ribosomal protein S13 [Acidobacteria bacterium Mor1]